MNLYMHCIPKTVKCNIIPYVSNSYEPDTKLPYGVVDYCISDI